MTEPVIVALECTCDLMQGVEGFLNKQEPPEAFIELNGVCQFYQFKNHGDSFVFCIQSALQKGTNYLTLNYVHNDITKNFGNLQVTDVRIHGCSVTFDIFNCEYKSYDGSIENTNTLYLGKPGQWRYIIESPVFEHYRGIILG